MNRITRKAYAKINLALDVKGRRDDGYHLVDMIMQSVDIYDTLTIMEHGRTEGFSEKLVTDRDDIPTGSDNLIVRAVEIMKSEYEIRSSMLCELTKRIPVAAGMAGGSADAAAAFIAMRDMFVPEVSDGELEKLALPLGADIPYCIRGGTARAEGIGEKLSKLDDIPECALVIVKPPVGVPTGEVYRSYDGMINVSHPDIEGIIRKLGAGDIKGAMKMSGNVLEPVTAGRYTVIGELEKFLSEHGSFCSMMTGSGPTVFGMFDTRDEADEAYRALKEHSEYGSFECFDTATITAVR